MSFKDPWILILIPVCLGIMVLFKSGQRQASFRFPSKELLKGVVVNWKIQLTKNMVYMRLLILVLFLVALAGPQDVLDRTEIRTEGIDIVLAVDASGSMAAEDFVVNAERVNRLEVVKEVVHDFIRGRSGDRIGLVVFAGLAYTVCPLTTDYDWLLENLQRVNLELIGQDGTAIGSAIASSVGRLQESSAKSKVIILLTDGVHNAGTIDPVTAAKAAASFGIKIYTIGAGSKGLVPFPTRDFFGRPAYQNVRIDLDEQTLQEVAKLTDGQYFWAKDTKTLKQVYQLIDELEKTEIIETGYHEYRPLFDKVVMTALALLLLEIILTNTVLLKIP